MTENKFLNSLIVVLIISIIAVVYYWISQSSQRYFSFTVSDVVIGKYSSYKECIEDEQYYNQIKLGNEAFSEYDGNCDWYH